MIYTSYFAYMKNIPEDIVCISICGGVPDWYKGLQYKRVAPKKSFFIEWKKTRDNDYYIKHFIKEVLDPLDVNEVVKELQELSNGKDIALICYEKPSDFCHRHLVSTWLNLNGYPCIEFNKELYERGKI